MVKTARSASWSLGRGCQVVALSEGRVLIEHPSGSSVLRVEPEALGELFAAAATRGADGASELLGADARADGASLLRSLELAPPSFAEARVTVLGNGPWSASLARLLGDVLGANVTHVLLETAPVAPRWRYPARAVTALRDLGATAAGAFDQSDVVVCALEDVTLSSFHTLNRLAIDARAAAIFAFFERGSLRIAPVLYDGTPPCFYCERVRALGLEPASPILAEALEALVVDGSASSPLPVQAAGTSAVIDDIVRLLADGVPHAPGTVLTVSGTGSAERASVPALPGCPGCSERPRRPATTERFIAPTSPSPTVAARGDVVGRTVRELERRGASVMRHAVTSFLDHLRGTWAILSRWGEAEALCLAGLCHSVYGSDAFDKALFSRARRETLRALIGTEAEELVSLFSDVDRRRLWDGTSLSATLFSFRTGEPIEGPATLGVRLALLDLANDADQTAEDDGSPGLWLATRVLRAQSLGSEHTPPPFRGVVLAVEQERHARGCYLDAASCTTTDPDRAFASLLEASVLNPIPGEPCVVAAELALRLGRRERAAALASEGAARLRLLGTSWDKRGTWDEWIGRALRIARSASGTLTAEPEG